MPRGAITFTDSTKWMLLEKKYYYNHDYKQIATFISLRCQQGIVCSSVHIWIPFIQSLPTHTHTNTQHHFTRHQTLTKSLFSAACWHSNSRLTKSNAGRILIKTSQSQSCMWECYLHMRGSGFHPAHCLHTHPAVRDAYLHATLPFVSKGLRTFFMVNK